MKYLTLISLFLGIIYSDKKDRNLYNPCIAFPLLWTVIFWLGQLRLFTLLDTSKTAIMCIQIGTVCFTIGALLCERFRYKYMINTIHRQISDGKQFDYFVLYVIAIICIVYFLPGFIRIFPTLLSGPNALSQIRNAAQSAEANKGFANFYYNFIILPLSIVIEILGVVDFWFGDKKKRIFLLSIAVIALRVLSDAGRTPLFDFFIYMLLGFAFFMKKKNVGTDNAERKKRIRQVRVYGIIAVAFLALSTISRAGSSLWRLLYFYFAMPSVMLSKWIETVDASRFYSYGFTSFNGLFYGVSYIVKNAFSFQHPEIIIDSFKQIIATDATWIRINEQTTTANAYVSVFWFFYSDFRLIGVIVFSFLYGIFMCNLYLNACRSLRIRDICLFFLGFQGLFFSFIRFPFAKTYYWIAFFVVQFVLYRMEMIPTFDAENDP